MRRRLVSFMLTYVNREGACTERWDLVDCSELPFPFVPVLNGKDLHFATYSFPPNFLTVSLLQSQFTMCIG